ncbi:hypothetical protein [Staphylococcus equorum]|uniref:hypothetical protein n=1 Tax=Staphylococcus equorum TaxID=246432 RepID=UPI003FD8DDD7
MKNENIIDVNDNRELLIWHAKVVLNSRLTGVEISKETGVNAQQVCLYRNGKRNIEGAYLNNLMKLSRLYQTHDLFETIRRMEGMNNNG